MLPERVDGVSAESAGWNLMSPAAVEYAHDRAPAARRGGGTVQTGRLWRNMLSSQPLAFSVAGELRAHRAAALRVLATLTGRDLARFVVFGRDRWILDGLDAEWAPEPDGHLADRSAADLAAALETAGGERLLVTIEVKYTEPFSPARLAAGRYDRALAAAKVDDATERRLRREGGTQFLRSVLLTHAEQRRGRCDDVLAVVLGRDDDGSARRVTAAVGSAVSVPTAYWTFSSLFGACAEQPDLAAWADRMTRRYCPPAG